MPGKWDSHDATSASKLGNYVPGSKEAKSWVDGWHYRYSGPALSVPITNNPWNTQTHPVERIAWDAGWTEANANTAGVQRGPATTGAPPV